MPEVEGLAKVASVGAAETSGGLPRCGPKPSLKADWRDAGRSGGLEVCVHGHDVAVAAEHANPAWGVA